MCVHIKLGSLPDLTIKPAITTINSVCYSRAGWVWRFIGSQRCALVQTIAVAVTCTILTPGLAPSPAQAESFRVSYDTNFGFYVQARPAENTLVYSDEDAFKIITEISDFQQQQGIGRAMLSPDMKTLDLGTNALNLGTSHGARGGVFAVSEGERLRLGNGIIINGGSELEVSGAQAEVEAPSLSVSSFNEQLGKLSITDGGVVRLGGHVYPGGIGNKGQFWAGNSHDARAQAELEIDGEGSLFEITPERNRRVTFVQGLTSDPAIVSTATITVSNGGVFRIHEATGDFFQRRYDWDRGDWVEDYISQEEANSDPYGAHPNGHLTFNIGAASGDAPVAPGFLDFHKPLPLGGATSQLVFNHTNTDYEFGTAISGAGSVLVENGTTILTGQNTYTGGTTIEGGALHVAEGGSIVGDIANNSALVFAPSDALTYGNVISGSGSLTKEGSGTLTLTGDSTYTGGTTVSEGALLVNGRVKGAVTLDGGVLGGNGTVGAVTLNRGSTLAPGNSIGTLNVDGDITLTSGSTYAVEVNRDGGADRLAATGEARISGATAHISAENGTDTGITYAPSTRYIILTASGGVVGTFENVTDTFAFLDSNLDYEANEVILILERNERGFHDITDTENQRNTAIGVDSLGADNDVFSAILGLSEEDARRAFDDLSGEAHASIDGLLIQNNSIGRNAVNNRLRSAFDSVAAGSPQAVALNGADAAFNTGTPMAWFEGYGNWSSISETDETAELDSLTAGFFAGLDTKTHSGWRVGLFGGYGNSSMTVDDRASSADADSFILGAYAGYRLNNFGFRFGASNAWHNITTDRDVTIGNFSNALSADYAATAFQAFGEVGYTHTTRIARIESFTGLALINQRTNDFVEDGGAAALSASTSSQAVGVFSLGTRFEREFAGFGNNAALLSGSLGWRRALGDLDPIKTMSFDGSSDVFTVTGAPVEENTFLVALGLRHEVEGVLFNLNYYSEFGDLAQNQGLNLNASFRF